jgi:hypothetical protein
LALARTPARCYHPPGTSPDHRRPTTGDHE